MAVLIFSYILNDILDYIYGLNMFFVSQVSVKFEINFSLQLLTNLVIYLKKCVNLVLLTIFC